HAPGDVPALARVAGNHHPDGNARRSGGPAPPSGLPRQRWEGAAHVLPRRGGRPPVEARFPGGPAPQTGRRHDRAQAREGGGVMGWDSKLSYPPGAVLKVPVRATDAQKAAWESAARKHGMATAGAYLAWAADLHIAMSRAYFDAVLEHEESL